MDYFTIFWKKTLRYLLKPLSFVPALVMMYVIFSFSAQNGQQSGGLSYEVSKTLVLAYNKILSKGYSKVILNELIVEIHPLVRKSAHFAEYFLLAVTIVFPLYVYRIRGLFLPLTGLIFCAAIAGLDEYHQSFVAGRTPAFRDVIIDSCGSLCGLLTAHFACFIGRKTVFRFLSLEDYRRKKQEYEEQITEAEEDHSLV